MGFDILKQSFDFVEWASKETLDLNKVRQFISNSKSLYPPKGQHLPVTSKEILLFLSQNIQDHAKDLDFEKLERLKNACEIILTRGKSETKKVAKKELIKAAKVCQSVLQKAGKAKLFELASSISNAKPDKVNYLCHLLATLAPELSKQEKKEVIISLIEKKVIKQILHLDSKEKIAVIKSLGDQLPKYLYTS